MIVLSSLLLLLYLMTMTHLKLSGRKKVLLKEFVDADQFKSYDDLKKRLEYVLGSKRPTSSIEEEDTDRGAAEELVTAAVSTPLHHHCKRR